MKEVTLLEKFHDWLVDTGEYSNAEYIIFGILRDMTNRSGFQQTWWCIGDEIRNEIIETWIEIVSKQIEK